MLLFEEFIAESKETDERNKAIDLEGIIKTVLSKKGITDPKAFEDIYGYMADKKSFSLGKMTDMFPYSVGTMKAVIEAVKAAIDAQGYGKKGSDTTAPLSQAGRIDRYLKDVNRSNRLR
jgi:hypothetical protein